ncbi:outer membrane beta-barrel protein [Marinoscillum pacificum]|uniref:outer membrane beta-barrel protein n=1 Tax=Marinoscillum pacificum TaxID=392723 RepID=UPI002158897F|nr:outer membrane beta-barrel protein [Marinoscillum pacificum]
MLVKYVLGVALLMSVLSAAAQDETITAVGSIKDAKDQSAVIGATIFFKNVKDSPRSKYAVSAVDGSFQVKNLEQAFYRIIIQSLSYKTYTQIIRVSQSGVNLGVISLEPDSKVLDVVEIKGDVVPVEQKGDTILYNADAFKVNPDASTRDLVSKMPGIVVDDDGVSANGETVQQVLLDGKRFFGQDPLLSLNTIPAEVVKRVEVFDQMSEQSQLTGFNDGNTTKTINVVTKEEKQNGVFGRLYAGYGTNDLYTAGGNINSFHKDSRLTVMGMSNNINQQNFSSEDLAGVGGGGRGGFRGGPGQGSSGFFTGLQSGISKTNALGGNFTDNWGSKVTFEGSYFYNQTANQNDQETNRETFLTDETQTYDESVTSSSDNANHRFNSRITYAINDRNKLVVRPTLSYQNNSSQTHTLGQTFDEQLELINRTDNDYQSDNVAYNLENEVLFQHKFNKIGRSLSIEVTNKLNDITRDNYYQDLSADSLIDYHTDERVTNWQSDITYTEPVGGTAQLSTSYRVTHQSRSSDKKTYVDLSDGESDFVSSLSNKFESGYTTHSPSINFANRAFNKMFDFGLAYQYATLDNNQQFPTEGQYAKHFHSVLPTIMGRIDLPGGADMFLRYAGSTDEPSIDQLQNVIDNSSPLFLTMGNPELNQSYSNSLMVRFAKANVEKNTSLSNFTRVETTSNYITNATYIMTSDSVLSEDVTAGRGAQLSVPVNLDGYWNISNNTTHSVSISAIESNLNTSLGFSYKRLPGVTNNVESFSNTYGANGKLAVVSHINENIDFNVSYSVSGNLVKNSIQSTNNSQYVLQSLGGELNYIFWKGFVFRSDIGYQQYNGVSDASDVSYTLWNMSLAKKFLKNNSGELELSVFDLLGQNQSVSQSVGASYIEETRTQVLQQYFMLKFTYQVRKFG